MPLLGGRLCEAAWANPLLPLVKIILLQLRGAWALMPPKYASDSTYIVQP